MNDLDNSSILKKEINFNKIHKTNDEGLNPITIEDKKIKDTWKHIDRVYWFQVRQMRQFKTFFIAFLIIQYIFIAALTITFLCCGLNSSIVITFIVSVSIETIGIFAIMTKYIFSNQTSPLVKSIFKYEISSKENLNPPQNQSK